jgi:tRNA A-37 threonylcarbamoyl transferase component Bud32
MTTLYRAGEAKRVFTRTLKLWDAGLAVPRPILQMERRRFGMVVESWFVYCYEPGRRCSKRHLPQVTAILDRLHRLGYTHGDPHPRNWVQHEECVVALDLCPRKKWPHGFWVAYDYVLLKRHALQINRPAQVKRPYWWAAKRYYRWIVRWRRIKKGTAASSLWS